MTNIPIFDKVGTAILLGSVVTYPLNPNILNDTTTASGVIQQTFRYHSRQTRLRITPSAGGADVSRYNTDVTVTG